MRKTFPSFEESDKYSSLSSQCVGLGKKWMPPPTILQYKGQIGKVFHSISHKYYQILSSTHSNVSCGKG